jgi:hypothetical protein
MGTHAHKEKKGAGGRRHTFVAPGGSHKVLKTISKEML